MKLRIMQEGGGLTYTPFIPGAQGTASSSRSSSSEDSKLDPLDKEILSMIKDQSFLPSDTKEIFNMLIRFQKQTQRLSAYGADSYRTAMPGMLKILGKINEAKYNKTQSDEIIKRMATQNAGADVALDAYGRMYVYNKEGKMQKLDASKFDRNEYIPVSNSELLALRQRQLGFQDNIMNDLENLVGMATVQQEISRIINDIGSVEVSSFVKNTNAQNVLKALFEEGPDGIYKLSEKDRNEGLQPAWNAIYGQLSQNMRNVLKANAAILGTDPLTLIQDVVLRNTDKKKDISYDASASKAAGFDTDPLKTGSDQLTEKPYLMQIGNLEGTRTNVSIAPRAAKISDTAVLTATAFTYGTTIDRNNKPLDSMSLAKALQEGEGFAAGSPDTVVFGNKLLNGWEQEAILFDKNSNFTVVMLPFKEERWHKVPDFDKLDDFNKLQKILSDNPGLTKMELIEQAKKLNINWDELNYDSDTNTISLKNTMAFISVSGYASDNTLDLTKENKQYLESVDRSDGQHIKDYYNNMIKYGTLHPAKKGNVAIKGYSTSGNNDFWRGNIFIPMDNAYYSMLLSGKGETISKSSLRNYSGLTAAREYEVQSQQYRKETDPDYEKNRRMGKFSDE